MATRPLSRKRTRSGSTSKPRTLPRGVYRRKGLHPNDFIRGKPIRAQGELRRGDLVQVIFPNGHEAIGKYFGKGKFFAKFYAGDLGAGYLTVLPKAKKLDIRLPAKAGGMSFTHRVQIATRKGMLPR